MIKHINVPIARGKLKHFDEILKACNGRYINDPYPMPDKYGYWRVSCSFDNSEDSNLFNKHWDRVTTDIKEIQPSKSWVKKLFNRFKSYFC